MEFKTKLMYTDKPIEQRDIQIELVGNDFPKDKLPFWINCSQTKITVGTSGMNALETADILNHIAEQIRKCMEEAPPDGQNDPNYLVFCNRILDRNGEEMNHTVSYPYYRQLTEEILGARELFTRLDKYLTEVICGEHAHKTPRGEWFLKRGWRNYAEQHHTF